MLKVRPIQCDKKDFACFIELCLESHCIERIQYDYRSLSGINDMLREFLKGQMLAYLAFDEDGVAGCIFGPAKEDEWEVHALFKRHKNTLEALNEIEKQVIPKFKFKRVFARIPVSNKAPQLMFRRFGAKYNGISKDHFRVNEDKYEDCVIMEKEY
jgi:hypothetical protein